MTDGSASPAAVDAVVQRRLAVAPTPRLAVALALTAPLWALSGWSWGLVAAAAAVGACLAAAVVDAVLVPGADALEPTRDAPPAVGLGDAAEVTYGVRSRWPRRARLALVDRLPDGVRRDGRAALPLVVEPDGEAHVTLPLVGVRRGVHALGPLALVVDGPLGLVRRTHRFVSDDACTVAPSVAEVRRVRLLTAQHRLRDAGVRQQRRRGEGGTAASLREYAPGDDPRHIDWKASARRTTPVVREHVAERGQTVLLAVDAGRLMTQRVARDAAVPRSRFDAALDAALVLADVASRAGDRVGLLVFDDAVRAWVPPLAGGGTVRRLRDALVGVHPALVESDYATAFRTLAERHRRRSLVVLFTDAIDARASRALLAHVARGRARHLPLVVALRDEALDAAASPAAAAERATALAVYEAAAAEELLQARADALARMRQAGAAVLDVPASALVAPVVNRYLAMKARGEI